MYVSAAPIFHARYRLLVGEEGEKKGGTDGRREASPKEGERSDSEQVTWQVKSSELVGEEETKE